MFGIFQQSVWMQSIAWHNLGYIKNNLECLFSAEKMKEGKQYQKDNMIQNTKNLEYVSEPWLEYNAQMWVMMYGLYKLQQLATGMNFHLPWLGGVGELFTLMFPILFSWVIHLLMTSCVACGFTQEQNIFARCAISTRTIWTSQGSHMSSKTCT